MRHRDKGGHTTCVTDRDQYCCADTDRRDQLNVDKHKMTEDMDMS